MYKCQSMIPYFFFITITYRSVFSVFLFIIREVEKCHQVWNSWLKNTESLVTIIALNLKERGQHILKNFTKDCSYFLASLTVFVWTVEWFSRFIAFTGWLQYTIKPKLNNNNIFLFLVYLLNMGGSSRPQNVFFCQAGSIQALPYKHWLLSLK